MARGRGVGGRAVKVFRSYEGGRTVSENIQNHQILQFCFSAQNRAGKRVLHIEMMWKIEANHHSC
jgi:hypothetical protein